jgi:hypothetical protein
MRVRCRCGKPSEEDRSECFNCRIRSVGFAFVGGGGYTRKRFNDATITEKRAEILGDRVLGVDVEPASNYGW